MVHLRGVSQLRPLHRGVQSTELVGFQPKIRRCSRFALQKVFQKVASVLWEKFSFTGWVCSRSTGRLVPKAKWKGGDEKLAGPIYNFTSSIRSVSMAFNKDPARERVRRTASTLYLNFSICKVAYLLLLRFLIWLNVINMRLYFCICFITVELLTWKNANMPKYNCKDYWLINWNLYYEHVKRVSKQTKRKTTSLLLLRKRKKRLKKLSDDIYLSILEGDAEI